MITKTGTGTPVPTNIDVSAIAMLVPPQLDIEQEKWAGMYVRVTQVRADGAPISSSGIEQFSVGPFYVNDTEAPLPKGIVAGTCFDEILAIVEYARNYGLVPRQTSSVTIGSSCP